MTPLALLLPLVLHSTDLVAYPSTTSSLSAKDAFQLVSTGPTWGSVGTAMGTITGSSAGYPALISVSQSAAEKPTTTQSSADTILMGTMAFPESRVVDVLLDDQQRVTGILWKTGKDKIAMLTPPIYGQGTKMRLSRGGVMYLEPSNAPDTNDDFFFGLDKNQTIIVVMFICLVTWMAVALATQRKFRQLQAYVRAQESLRRDPPDARVIQ